ncbi:serine/threonine protein kinase [Mycolicibacterium brumae]|uniref:non-specific serine/threonine protein kinase n=2 Tax=Mycolicibacterium brumae TaxID=85968 RepID=A0A2G5P5C0_9MYCO|nr:serine/threonine protein kinase [Mycolicibacterium brumae]PIB73485.1 serine/threonine protein kinase [Mycolicibacterium brumae]UWW08258.1 serine/threonine protein kinase [Mycolicibacterium brumae]
MGEVYLVQHPRLPRQDALKLLDTNVSRNAQFQVRFIREAELLAPLRHPNIITIYDRGEYEGRLWLTMEFIDGQDAAQLVKARGALSLELATEIIAGAGAALDHAYGERKITHRDVKPANILVELDRAGDLKSVKLADFGIAKAGSESTSLTSTGMTIGTMSYISPEAIDGRELDNRADVYSLGCTAFDLLTGAPPYVASPVSALMMRHVSAPVPRITDANRALPRALDAVFARVLAKEPRDRYATCAEFVAALRTAAAPEVVVAEPPVVDYPAGASTMSAPESMVQERTPGTATAWPAKSKPEPWAQTEKRPTTEASKEVAPNPPVSTKPQFKSPLDAGASTDALPPGFPSTSKKKLGGMGWLVVALCIPVAIAAVVAGVNMVSDASVKSASSPTITSHLTYPTTAYPTTTTTTNVNSIPRYSGVPPASYTGIDPYGVSCAITSLTDSSVGWGVQARRGSKSTSCLMAANTLRAYWNSGPVRGVMPDPAVGFPVEGSVPCSTLGPAAECGPNDTIIVRCSPLRTGDYVACTGGRAAVVYIY